MAEYSEDTDGMWVITEPSVDGSTYIVSLSFGQDLAFTLTPIRATAYSNALLAAISDAEYDHAVFRLMTERLGTSLEETAALLNSLRKDRPTREAAGLIFGGGVAHRNLLPFVQIVKDGKVLGQLTPARARKHVLHVLEAVPVADLDANFYRALRSTIGTDENTARNVVQDLSNWRLDPFIDIDDEEE